MRFMMLICGEEGPAREPSKDELDATLADVRAWSERWADHLVEGGAKLRPATTAKTVRADRDGRPLVIDGPYTELREVIGGVILLECADIDQAVAIAADWPRLRADSWTTAVEVRPVMSC
jgi:hypothetical protein